MIGDLVPAEAGAVEEVAGLVTRFDHVAVAVRDLATAAPLYADLFGGRLIAGGDDDRLAIRSLQLSFPPGVKIELLQPLHERSYLAAYLDKRGPGFHHMTCFVEDVTEAAARLEAAGFSTVDTRTGTGCWDETFIRPSSAFGTLVQLTDSPLSWTEPVLPEGAGIGDVLAGRIAWNDARPTWR
ncbi:VOC family protein [Prauserella flavalba]|uniref:VOC family protein n=1 Tax=Prauserella flavalba TaxID=1477506 RepID=UPI00143D7B9C|nr:VOC family protein [Prauserella flavalba]